MWVVRHPRILLRLIPNCLRIPPRENLPRSPFPGIPRGMGSVPAREAGSELVVPARVAAAWGVADRLAEMELAAEAPSGEAVDRLGEADRLAAAGREVELRGDRGVVLEWVVECLVADRWVPPGEFQGLRVGACRVAAVACPPEAEWECPAEGCLREESRGPPAAASACQVAGYRRVVA